MEHSKYASFLKNARKKAGFSQEELAHRLFIQQSDVSKIENGVKELPISLAAEWLQVTNAHFEFAELLCGGELPPFLEQLKNKHENSAKKVE